MKLKIGDYVKYEYSRDYFLIMRVEEISGEDNINLFVVYDSDTTVSLKGRLLERWKPDFFLGIKTKILTPGEVFAEVL